MPPLRICFVALISLSALSAVGESQKLSEPTAVIDTTAGRLTCTLLTQERPVTTARFIALAQGASPGRPRMDR